MDKTKEKDLKPSVVFQLNQNLDVQVGTMFLGHKKAGIDFGGGIIRHHPALAGALQVEGEKRKKMVEGYVSIFNCNPRFLDTKTFQVYYQNRSGVVHVTAHEMLHFIFYDWLERNDQEFIDNTDKEKAWTLSEVFDIVAFDRQEFNRFKSKGSGGYPDLQPIATKIIEELKNYPFTVNSFLSIAKESI
ncbi:hypothetical protein COT44_00245 [Candidatus Shapirobacteria bacterium CG08_land_8_20_14_0_20_39_18]|uniref:Uncharacterized protein n=1 Tax=Candidatus Shapirobacteria bacterium CG08_land_8_20_14_0_20_39_18 TaxID=1974883 RepID=A0A2M6XE56_9BACT|nr:MAG: hypothetical protein COT44_00245 [Candidatus Shapirobacteria bacterium CG08_land_8_20_14_0_20_39_18]PIY64698.1 MAG: hypothetical protein COY91_04485 [Candidatus Shapirobacteria bacterium CG_4_10_14_0_8_um_filter_39_15]PJE68765.1 MAG: hypothetical protein COU94_00400 [Candidatus Shapirobacteria bacterium CG10_big_fil_rev_8_21_14_0_10_38_8]